MGLWFLQEKRAQVVVQLPEQWGHFPEAHLSLTIWESLGESLGLHHQGSERNGEPGWGSSSQHTDLSGLHSCMQLCPSGEPSQLLGHQQGSQWPQVASKLSWQHCLISVCK